MSPFPSPTQDLAPRQIWAVATPSASRSVTDCFSYRIHAGGAIRFNDSLSVPLLQDAILRPFCSADNNGRDNMTREVLDNAILDVRDPYFSSTSPVLFVEAICLTIAWVLLMMLLITPRTFYHGGPGYGVGQMRTGNSGGNFPIVGIGSRPWFQKVATLTVAVSLLIATVRTFDVAADQYSAGIQDSIRLTYETLDGYEIRTIRFISSIFEWLAQAQTSLRLFQRHREKVVIKWTALGLILLEMIFGILNNFTHLGTIDQDYSRLRPRQYSNAIPALQYLFEMALSLMYAAVVLYYSLTKRRFSYYHPKMRNICLVAMLAITAVAVPVVFFILDIAVPSVASWGDYVRWVGAAAASVIVWEWVERIEALERDERKDGILGREIFEGDEMLDESTGPDGTMRGGRRRKINKTDSNTSTIAVSSQDSLGEVGSMKRRLRNQGPRFPRLDRSLLAKIAILRTAKKSGAERRRDSTKSIELQPAAPRQVHHRRRRSEAAGATGSSTDLAVQPPEVTPSPISRSDCNSASTVYRVVHHPITPTSTPGISETLYPQGNAMNVSSPSPDTSKGKKRASDLVAQRAVNMANLNPFRRKNAAHTPEAIENTREHASAEEELEKANTSTGWFSRFRRNQSDERDLPPLTIPWRGDDTASIPQDTDLEAGLGGDEYYNQSVADIYADPTDQDDESPFRHNSPSQRNSPANAENPAQGARAHMRHIDTPSNERRPP